MNQIIDLLKKKKMCEYFKVIENRAINYCNTIEIHSLEEDNFLSRRLRIYKNVKYVKTIKLINFYNRSTFLSKKILIYKNNNLMHGIYTNKLFLISWILDNKNIRIEIPNNEFPLRFSNKKFVVYVSPISHKFIKKYVNS